MATTAPSDREPLVPVQRGSELDVADYLRQWLAHVRGRVRAVTYEGYEVLVRRHALPRVGHLKLRELRPLDLQNLYSELLARGAEAQPLSAGTVLNLHLVLRQAFGQAVRWQLLDANPVAGAQPPRPRRPPRLVVDPPLLARLLASVAGTWLETPAAIACATGMRRGEILGLRWDDLDPELTLARVQRTLQPTQQGLVFEQPKTARSRRTVLLHSEEFLDELSAFPHGAHDDCVDALSGAHDLLTRRGSGRMTTHVPRGRIPSRVAIARRDLGRGSAWPQELAASLGATYFPRPG